jgi:hypothetical protein
MYILPLITGITGVVVDTNGTMDFHENLAVRNLKVNLHTPVPRFFVLSTGNYVHKKRPIDRYKKLSTSKIIVG